MALLRTKKRLVTSFAVIVLLCGAAFYALAQQTGEAKKAPAPQAGPKRHKLAATLETDALRLTTYVQDQIGEIELVDSVDREPPAFPFLRLFQR